MKELNDIKNEVCQEKYDCTFLQACIFMNIMDMESIMNEAAKRYAQQCCEDLRKRIIQEKQISEEDGYESVGAHDIESIKIILP